MTAIGQLFDRLDDIRGGLKAFQVVNPTDAERVAGDFLQVLVAVEEGRWREMTNDLRSMRILVQGSLDETHDRASIGNLMAVRDLIDRILRQFESVDICAPTVNKKPETQTT